MPGMDAIGEIGAGRSQRTKMVRSDEDEQIHKSHDTLSVHFMQFQPIQ